MPITLKIVSYQRLTPGQQETFSSDRDKLSIGRGSDNDLTLPDPQRFMSGTHCWIENRDGSCYLTDTSTNGVFINGSGQRVAKGDSVELDDGDRIKLGDYELEISLDSAMPKSSPFGDVAQDGNDDGDEDYFATPEPPPPAPRAREDSKDPNTPLSQIDSSLLGDSISIDELHGLDNEEEEEDPPSLRGQEDRASPLRHHFPAPEINQQPDADLPDKYRLDNSAIPESWDEETGMLKRPPAQAEPESPAQSPGSSVEIPDDWDEETGLAEVPDDESDAPQASPADAPEPTPANAAPPPTRPRPQTPLRADSALAAFASGAGLDGSKLQVEDQAAFFHELGALLQTMTSGIMQAIASRNQIKSEFRLEQTMIAPTENNPLKFSVTPQEALKRLVQHSESAYLGGAEAARQAIDDINAHQMAVVAGTEAALQGILRRFKPESLEARLGATNGIGKLLPMLRKAKSWDFYRALYQEVSEAADDDFHQFFGSEFTKAYEQQLDRLKHSKKDNT